VKNTTILKAPITPAAGYRRNVDYDEALERSVLGVCIIEPGAFGSIYTHLGEECFYNTHHRTVYQALHTLWQQGSAIDMLTLNRHLCSAGTTTLGDGNTAWYLSTLTADVVNGAHLPQWCALLRRLAARRQLINLTAGGLVDDDVETTIAAIQQQLQHTIHTHTPNDWIDTTTAARTLAAHMEQAATHTLAGISTGLPALDHLNGGLRPGQLVVIGARPGTGKSALAAGIALQAARQGHSTGIISLEMSAHELMARLLSRETQIPYSQIDRRGAAATPQLHQTAHTHLAALSQLPIWFADHAQMTIHDIRARAEKLKRQHNLALLVVDYLQLVEEDSRHHNRSREQGVSAISRGLKTLAMQLQIPIIALSQLNRDSETRANKRPTMADLRESGAIEQDADIIMLLHRDWRCGIATDPYGQSTEYQADLFVAKWRNGATLDLRLHFDPPTMTFSERP